MRNKLARSLAAVIVAAPLPLVAGAVVESAQAATPAPTCVYRTWWREGLWSYVYVANNCASHKYVKIVWNWATDSGCKSMWPGESVTESRGRQASLGGVYTCSP